MAIKFSDELRQAIAFHPGQAVPLIDGQANKTYYVVGEDFLFQRTEQDESSRDPLLELIREGEAGPEVSPKEGLAKCKQG